LPNFIESRGICLIFSNGPYQNLFNGSSVINRLSKEDPCVIKGLKFANLNYDNHQTWNVFVRKLRLLTYIDKQYETLLNRNYYLSMYTATKSSKHWNKYGCKTLRTESSYDMENTIYNDIICQDLRSFICEYKLNK
jgi:hypothetical protein